MAHVSVDGVLHPCAYRLHRLLEKEDEDIKLRWRYGKSGRRYKGEIRDAYNLNTLCSCMEISNNKFIN